MAVEAVIKTENSWVYSKNSHFIENVKIKPKPNHWFLTLLVIYYFSYGWETNIVVVSDTVRVCRYHIWWNVLVTIKTIGIFCVWSDERKINLTTHILNDHSNRLLATRRNWIPVGKLIWWSRKHKQCSEMLAKSIQFNTGTVKCKQNTIRIFSRNTY